MRRIVKVLILSALCSFAVCCGKKADPLQETLGAYILRGQEGIFTLYRIEKIDSTTFRTEFERRQYVFDLKLEEETNLYESYIIQGKPKNAARHLDAIQRTHEVLKGLDSLRTAMDGRMDEIAYYDYVFSGQSVIGDETTNYLSAYASITPALEVIALTAKQKDLHKSGGRAIPGYLQMVKSDEDE